MPLLNSLAPLPALCLPRIAEIETNNRASSAASSACQGYCNNDELENESSRAQVLAQIKINTNTGDSILTCFENNEILLMKTTETLKARSEMQICPVVSTFRCKKLMGEMERSFAQPAAIKIITSLALLGTENASDCQRRTFYFLLLISY